MSNQTVRITRRRRFAHKATRSAILAYRAPRKAARRVAAATRSTGYELKVGSLTAIAEMANE